MQNSGTKLVLALLGLALVLGGTSWWYRYEAAHRATQFWGAEASRLIAEGKGFEAWAYRDGPIGGGAVSQKSEMLEFVKDLGTARGQAHLRHALMSDRNYVWDQPLESAEIQWLWQLEFSEGERKVSVLLSKDLESVGKYELLPNSASTLVSYSCKPMTASLKAYFQDLGLLDRQESAASTAAE